MEIPKQNIDSHRNYVDGLKQIEFIHYRDINTNIDSTNFQICTKVDFKAIEKSHDNVLETWGRLKDESTVIYDFKSKSGSRYFINDNGDVYRLSNHWGAVASCEWTRDGEGQLMMSIFESGEWEIGVANLSDFEIFRRKQDRRVDIIINPEWVAQMMIVIPTYNEIHSMIKENPEFNNLSNEDKQYLGQNYGYFRKCLTDVII